MAYKKTQHYTNEDYFNYVMSLKYSEAIEMLNWISQHQFKINMISDWLIITKDALLGLWKGFIGFVPDI